tara:strand:+ start:883 stop:1845 length:963 start_codon:yes stop_codon:yes gene_type:complete
MPNSKKILNLARKVIQIEKQSIGELANQLTDDFSSSVNLISNSKGRVIVTGIGKGANIANKIVSTLNSTGQPANFLHAVDAFHGDLGNIQKGDIVICISKSGNTEEIRRLIMFVRNLGNKIISICGNSSSFLAKESDYFLDSSVKKEACPNNLAPTSSTTAQLVLGDALAVCLLKSKQFSDKDFARFHPGGILGKQLSMRVSDIMCPISRPIVNVKDQLDKVILEISNKRLGSTAVIKDDKLTGIITDGDLRRMLEKKKEISKLVAADIMSINPKQIQIDSLANDALNLMKENNINQLIVMDGSSYVGIIHMHDILKEGL